MWRQHVAQLTDCSNRWFMFMVSKARSIHASLGEAGSRWLEEVISQKRGEAARKRIHICHLPRHVDDDHTKSQFWLGDLLGDLLGQPDCTCTSNQSNHCNGMDEPCFVAWQICPSKSPTCLLHVACCSFSWLSNTHFSFPSNVILPCLLIPVVNFSSLITPY